MPYTDIDICSNALAILGTGPISSFTDETSAHAAPMGIRYPMVRDAVMSGYPWKFTLKQALLTRLIETPVTRYSTYHQMPSDMISGVVALYRTDNENEEPFTDFVIQGDRILSNQTTLYAEYQQDIDEGDWPAYYTDFMANVMAAEMAFSVTKQQGIAADVKHTTYGPKGRGTRAGLEGATQNIDAKTSPANNRLHRFSLIDARHSGAR